MRTISPRLGGILLTAVLAVVAAGVGGFVLTRSTEASDVELTTANFVPASAGGYVALNTDLTSSQWLATFKLVERMGQKDAEKQLKSTVTDESPLDWEKDVAPFLGGNAAIFFHGVSIDSPTSGIAVVARCKDADRALAILVDQSGAKFAKQSYAGISYVASDFVYAAVSRGHLIVATDEDMLKESLDVAAGKKPALAGQDRFKTLRDELSKDFLAFVYLAPETLLGDSITKDAALRKALDSAGAGDFALQPLAAVLSANATGFQFQEAASGKPGSVAPMLQPHESRFAKLVPADSAFFFSTNQIAETWDQSVAKSSKQIDDAIREDGEFRNLDDVLQKAGQEIGLQSAKEIIDLLHGETAFALWYPTRTEEQTESVFLADVKDEAKARDVLGRVTKSSPSARATTEKVAGVDMTTVTDRGEDPLAYAVTNGYMAVGSPAGVRTILEKKGPVLSDAAKYQRSAGQVPSKLATFAYFDLGSLLRLTSGGVPPELDDAASALEGLILNIALERDIVRLNGALTVAK